MAAGDTAEGEHTEELPGLGKARAGSSLTVGTGRRPQSGSRQEVSPGVPGTGWGGVGVGTTAGVFPPSTLPPKVPMQPTGQKAVPVKEAEPVRFTGRLRVAGGFTSPRPSQVPLAAPRGWSGCRFGFISPSAEPWQLLLSPCYL